MTYAPGQPGGSLHRHRHRTSTTLPPQRAQRPGAAPAARPKRLRVIWLGRRRIPGIDAGTELRLEGMVTVRDGLPTIFNPRYEILSRQEEQ